MVAVYFSVTSSLRQTGVGRPTPNHRDLLRGSLDPVFARDSGWCSVLFSIKEESTRLATSSPFSKRPNGKGPLRVKQILPPARAPLQKTPTESTGPALSSNMLTHVLQATSAQGRRSDTARRASSATASSLISWTLFP